MNTAFIFLSLTPGPQAGKFLPLARFPSFYGIKRLKSSAQKS